MRTKKRKTPEKTSLEVMTMMCYLVCLGVLLKEKAHSDIDEKASEIHYLKDHSDVIDSETLVNFLYSLTGWSLVPYDSSRGYPGKSCNYDFSLERRQQYIMVYCTKGLMREALVIDNLYRPPVLIHDDSILRYQIPGK